MCGEVDFYELDYAIGEEYDYRCVVEIVYEAYAA